jgi:hypothetical protein
MRARGHAAARAEILHAGERVFLEVERFDRFPGGGRRNVLSMYALDAQFVGSLQSWDVSASELIRQRRIPASVGPEIHWRQLFGRLVANTDMHPGNLAFFVRGTRVIDLAPAYDMAPALYAPLLGHLREPAFEPPVPSPADAPHWEDVCAAAQEVWSHLANDDRVSAAFRTIARANARVVEQARRMGRLLPRA